MVNEWGGANVDGLDAARAHIREQMRDGGAICPCCGQFARVYKRTIHRAMARWLLGLYRRWFNDCRWYSTGEDWSRLITADAAKLAYWGLIQQKDHDPSDTKRRSSGLWQPTLRGIHFISGQLSVPKFAVVFNGQLLGLQGPNVMIETCLGKGFDYRELVEARAAIVPELRPLEGGRDAATR